ncbi:MAG: Fic family protein [Pyrinomonadaceae bacterium]|nr:Fic family protein [Pyrinomonadaceae bacterium]
MRISDFTDEQHGRLIHTMQDYDAYIPADLPPSLDPSWSLGQKISDADRALSELAGVSRTLPNPHLFINSFLRREAVLSSRIEGTQASLSELFFFEAAGQQQPHSDVQEVANYVNALNYAINRLNELPLSVRLLCEIHERLMSGVRGDEARLTPGQLRRSQNWIGRSGSSLSSATYVPPPPEEMHRGLGELEKYFHAASDLPHLVRLAMIHYQFEAIHPFLDGNGRVGRLLITLWLLKEGLLSQPVLYLSAFFERTRDEYYRLLLAVSQKGVWQEWIEYFMFGVAEQSRDAIERAKQIIDLWLFYRQRFQNERQSVSMLRLLDEIIAVPVITYRKAEQILGVTPRAARQNVDKLVEAGLVYEVTQRSRYKIFAASEIISILDAPSG